MSEGEHNDAVYLKYKALEDMLKVIVYSSQSALGLTPMLYHLKHENREILFIQTGAVGTSIGTLRSTVKQTGQEIHRIKEADRRICLR